MLIDSNLVLLDDQSLADTVTCETVGLTSFLTPGREEPIPICIKVTEAAAGGTKVEIKLQECDTKAGTFTDVPGAAITAPLADLTAGKRLGWRWLPAEVGKPWIKLVVTLTGTFTAGKLFAALAREDDLPYGAGMYIDGGKVKG